jgi:cell wall-associated NlpC family hydrolase
VALPDGATAWIQAGDVTDDLRRLTLDEVLALSRRFIEAPYTWGGRSSFGFDCSGFTQMLMRLQGIPMPRDAHQQMAWEGLSEVDAGDLAPGDLLYFGPSADRVTHTGRHLGFGEFIHATVHLHPRVQVSELAGHWEGLLVGCRRSHARGTENGAEESSMVRW